MTGSETIRELHSLNINFIKIDRTTKIKDSWKKKPRNFDEIQLTFSLNFESFRSRECLKTSISWQRSAWIQPRTDCLKYGSIFSKKKIFAVPRLQRDLRKFFRRHPGNELRRVLVRRVLRPLPGLLHRLFARVPGPVRELCERDVAAQRHGPQRVVVERYDDGRNGRLRGPLGPHRGAAVRGLLRYYVSTAFAYA